MGVPEEPAPDRGLWVEGYVTDAGRTPLLAEDALSELVRLAHSGDETAAETVARAYRRLVVAVAKKYVRSSDPMTQLIPFGEAGLRTAIEKFDPAKGFRFSTYATWHIRQAITGGMSGPGPDPEGPDGAGDGHPRRPRPSSGAGSVALEEPVGRG